MNRNEILKKYAECIQDLDLSRDEISHNMGVSTKTLYNYLNNKVQMPLSKEIILVDYLNKHLSTTNKFTAIPIFNGYEYVSTNLNLKDLKVIANAFDEIKKVQQKYQITLFEELTDSNLQAMEFVYSRPYFRNFVTTLHNLFNEKKSLHYKCNELDKLFFSESKINEKNISDILTRYYYSKDKYTPEINQQLKNNENTIKELCFDFIDQLLYDYINKK